MNGLVFDGLVDGSTFIGMVNDVVGADFESEDFDSVGGSGRIRDSDQACERIVQGFAGLR